MVVTSHGSSPVVERHRRAAADHKSRVYHPFAMPKRRLISRNKYRETYDTSNETNRYTARYYVSLSHCPRSFVLFSRINFTIERMFVTLQLFGTISWEGKKPIR